MHIVLYTKKCDAQMQQVLSDLECRLGVLGVETSRLTAGESLKNPLPDMVLSIGGDGTLLSSVHAIGCSGVPVAGLNFGHLGFLTTAGRDDVDQLLHEMLAGNYAVEQRTLLQVCRDKQPTSYALNEAVLHRSDNQPLLNTSLYVDDEFVATYSADGLIVATPTGSTAYSLSCGGPILTPDCGCFVITPIGAHRLTLRPIIVPDSAAIRLVVEDVKGDYHLNLDSDSVLLSNNNSIMIGKADFQVNLVRMYNQSFFTAIHQKLAWGR